jgi:hypothetical protein
MIEFYELEDSKERGGVKTHGPGLGVFLPAERIVELRKRLGQEGSGIYLKPREGWARRGDQWTAEHAKIDWVGLCQCREAKHIGNHNCAARTRISGCDSPWRWWSLGKLTDYSRGFRLLEKNPANES